MLKYGQGSMMTDIKYSSGNSLESANIALDSRSKILKEINF